MLALPEWLFWLILLFSYLFGVFSGLAIVLGYSAAVSRAMRASGQ